MGSSRTFGALAAAALLTVGFFGVSSATGADAMRPTCSLLAARAGILASPKLPRRVKLDAGGRYGGGVDKLICRDFTHDGRRDMVATVLSGGTARTEAWVLFKAKTSWKLAFSRVGLYKAGIRASGRAVVESEPVFKANDQNCCPTGGYDHRRYSWRRGKMRLARLWHTARPT